MPTAFVGISLFQNDQRIGSRNREKVDYKSRQKQQAIHDKTEVPSYFQERI
jgi:hypothetical protein